MRRMCRRVSKIGLAAMAFVWAGPSLAQPLTADRAVEIALQHSTQAINAEAGVLDARGGLYSGYSGIIPRFTAGFTRSGSSLKNRSGSEVFGGVTTPSKTFDFEEYSSTPAISGTWSVLNLSAITGFRSAQSGLQAAKLQKSATRQDVAFTTRQQFYEVVRSIQLARVASEALRLARDDERRVNALFEVGSVSKSDVLKAQVRTSQSQLDSLTAGHAVTVQRVTLARLMGVMEPEVGEVDTVLTAEPRAYDEPAILADAERHRPDLLAAEAEVKSARSAVSSARYRRLPYVTLSGSAQFNPSSSSKTTDPGPPATTSVARTEADRSLSGRLSINWDFFDGLSTDAANAAAHARAMRAVETRDALRRNLASEVHEALLTYREVVVGEEVASRAVDSATENMKLTQQKYNVGSATILELIDAQVQLQRAQSDHVGALAAIRVAEARINRVRGQGE